MEINDDEIESISRSVVLHFEDMFGKEYGGFISSYAMLAETQLRNSSKTYKGKKNALAFFLRVFERPAFFEGMKLTEFLASSKRQEKQILSYRFKKEMSNGN